MAQVYGRVTDGSSIYRLNTSHLARSRALDVSRCCVSRSLMFASSFSKLCIHCSTGVFACGETRGARARFLHGWDVPWYLRFFREMAIAAAEPATSADISGGLRAFSLTLA